MRFYDRFLDAEHGQTIVEYAYLLLFVALTAMAGFTALGINVLDMLDSAARRMP